MGIFLTKNRKGVECGGVFQEFLQLPVQRAGMWKSKTKAPYRSSCSQSSTNFFKQ